MLLSIIFHGDVVQTFNAVEMKLFNSLTSTSRETARLANVLIQQQAQVAMAQHAKSVIVPHSSGARTTI